MMFRLSPPLTPVSELTDTLKQQGFAVLGAEDLCQWSGVSAQDLAQLIPSWDRLCPDQYLKDGGRYRQRRHASLVVDQAQVKLQPHRAHWQSLDYNALHGGLERWFEPMESDVAARETFLKLVQQLAFLFSSVKPEKQWFVESHQFRIDTTDGIGRPTPEGAHRDGVDFVAVFMIGRLGIKGGETRVFDAHGPQGMRFTLDQPWSVLILDDHRVIHESTPIQPLEETGYRDTLVLTYRAHGFQEPKN